MTITYDDILKAKEAQGDVIRITSLVFSETFSVLSPGGRLHVSDMLALSPDGPTATDSEAWSACVAGAEFKDIYLKRLETAGFIDIETTEVNTRYNDENCCESLNVASVKVVAKKPA